MNEVGTTEWESLRTAGEALDDPRTPQCGQVRPAGWSQALRYFMDSATASSSQRSFSGWPLWPFTTLNFTW